jgi:[acyl-carrier-protein] S-malonyltransferase
VTVAFLFPGQGVDLTSFAGQWQSRSSRVRTLLDHAAREAGVSLERILHGGGRALCDTAVYQPVLVAVSVGVYLEVVDRGVRPTVVAGHSLGEVSACVAAGALTPEGAVSVAAARGRAMSRAAARNPGGMLAIVARTRAQANDAVACARAHGWAQIAAHNSPDQWVITGSWPALKAVPKEFAPQPLATDGPWHSNAMLDAVEEYRHALGESLTGSCPESLVCNRTGQLMNPGDDIVELLAGQLTHPVEWTTTMRTLGTLPVNHLLTIGPAKALRMMARKSIGDVPVFGVDTPADLSRVAAAVLV